MTQRNWSSEAKQLLPHLASMLGGGVTVQAGGGGGLVAHALNSTTWHTGTLNESQAPWAVTYTVYDAHVANANAHHAKSHVLATAGGLGGDHSMSGASAGWVLRALSGTSAAFAQLQHGDLGGVAANQHHNQQHSITSTDHTIAGADWDVVMNVGTSTPGLRTPSYDVSGGQTALLRSNAGALTVNSLTAAGTSPKVRTPLIDTLSGDLALSPQSGWVALSSLVAAGRLRTPLLDTASGNMAISPAVDVTLSPVSDVVLNPGGWVELTNGKTLRTQSFASGFVGNGLRLDQGVSVAGQTSLEVDNVWVRGRMHVYELLIHQIRATNGSIFVSNTGKVTAVSGTGPYTLTTDPEHGFAVGDLIRAQRFTGTGVYQSNLQVTSVTNTKVFVATLSSGDAPAAGMDFVRLGNVSDANRRGGLYLTADDSGAPYMDIFDGVSSFATWGTAGVIKTRLGKLDGLGLPGSYTSEYGLYAGNGTLDSSTYIRLSNKTNRLNNLPLEWWSGGAKVVSIDSTNGIEIQTSTSYVDVRSVTWKSGTTKIGEVAAYSYPGSGRQVGLNVYQSSATDPAVLFLNATNTLGKWPYVVIQAQINSSGAPDTATIIVGRWEPLAFTGVYMDANAKVAGTLAVDSTLAVTGSASISSSISATSYGSFTGGQAIASAASPYYGFSVRADSAGAWARMHGFHTSGGSSLGGFWGYGGANSVEYFGIGSSYYAGGVIARFYPATNDAVFSGVVKGVVGSQGAPGFAFETYPNTGMYAVAGPEVVLTAGGTYNAIFGNTRFLLRVGTANVLYSATTSDAYLALGNGRTAAGNSYIDLYTDTVAGYNARLIRWTGTNGTYDMRQKGTGALRLIAENAADIELYTSGVLRMSVDSAGEITNATQHNGPTFNATTGFERNGRVGSIYIAVPSQTLVDTGGVAWGGVTKAVGTWTFDMQNNGNGFPAEAKAVCVMFQGNWASTANTNYAYVTTPGQTLCAVIRAHTLYTQETQAIVALDANGQFQCIIGGLQMTGSLMRVVGYFI